MRDTHAAVLHPRGLGCCAVERAGVCALTEILGRRRVVDGMQDVVVGEAVAPGGGVNVHT